MRRSSAPRRPPRATAMRTRASRRLAGAAVALLLAGGLGGCIGIQATATNQPASMGPVRLTTTACATGSPNCSATSNGGSIYGFLNELDSNQAVSAQVLYAVRLPIGPTPPASLTASVTGGGPPLGFERNESYEAELESLEPAPAGERWWGWISSAFPYSRNSKQGLTLAFDVTPPRPADGGPLPSPMRWRPVVGARLVDDGHPATRPVECGKVNAHMYQPIDDTGTKEPASSGSSVCIDSPSPDAARGYLEAPIVDFGLLGTKNVVSAGGTVGVVFQARRTGSADPTATFALTIDGGPPGALVSIDKSSVGLGGDAAQLVVATVVVPAGTAPGDYALTLTATATGKPVRTGVATLTVKAVDGPQPAATPIPSGPGAGPGPGADTAAPVLSALSLSKKAVKRKRGTSSLIFTVSEPAKVTATVSRVTKGRKAAGTCSAKAKAKRGARCEILKTVKTVAATAAAGKATIALPVRTLPKGSYRVSAVAVDAAGNASPTTAGIALKVS